MADRGAAARRVPRLGRKSRRGAESSLDTAGRRYRIFVFPDADHRPADGYQPVVRVWVAGDVGCGFGPAHYAALLRGWVWAGQGCQNSRRRRPPLAASGRAGRRDGAARTAAADRPRNGGRGDAAPGAARSPDRCRGGAAAASAGAVAALLHLATYTGIGSYTARGLGITQLLGQHNAAPRHEQPGTGTDHPITYTADSASTRTAQRLTPPM